MNYFLISCWGKAASLWLAGSLHMHPDIKCSGGTDHPIGGFDFWFNRNEYESYLNKLDQEKNLLCHVIEYFLDSNSLLNADNYIEKAGHGFMGSGNIIRYMQEKYNKLKGIIMQKRKPNVENISFYIEELNAYPKFAKVIGNVHGFYYTDLYTESFRKMLKKYNITFLNLVRDPISRWESQINNNIFIYHNYGLTFKNIIDEAFQSILPKAKYYQEVYKVDFDDLRNKVIIVNLHYWQINQSFVNEFFNPFNYPVLLIERLQKEPDYFAWLVDYISQGQVIADNEYLDKVYSVENINAGRNSSTNKVDKSPYDIWHSWPDWFKMEMRRQIKEYDMEKACNIHGYSIHYCK